MSESDVHLRNLTTQTIECWDCKTPIPPGGIHTWRACVDALCATVAALHSRRLPCAEAEVAQRRYESAEQNAEFYEKRAVEAECDSDRQFKLRAQAEVKSLRLQAIIDRIRENGDDSIVSAAEFEVDHD